jgi:hypothetical protein
MLHRLSHTEPFWSDAYARTFALILAEQEVPEPTDMKFEATKLLWSSSWKKFLEANFERRREYDRQTLIGRVFTFLEWPFVVLAMLSNPFLLLGSLRSLTNLRHPPLLRPSLSLLHKYLELYYIAHEKKDPSGIKESLGDTQCLSSAAEHLRGCTADEMSTIVQIWLQTNKLLTKGNGREEASFSFRVIHAFYTTLTAANQLPTKENGREEASFSFRVIHAFYTTLTAAKQLLTLTAAIQLLPLTAVNQLLTKENRREEASFPFIHAFYSTLIHKSCLLDLGGTLLGVMTARVLDCRFHVYPVVLLLRGEISRQSLTTSIPNTNQRQDLRDAILHFIKQCAPLPSQETRSSLKQRDPLPSQKTHSSLFVTLPHNPFIMVFDKLWISLRLKHWAIFAFALTLITQDLENDAPDDAQRILPRLWD